MVGREDENSTLFERIAYEAHGIADIRLKFFFLNLPSGPYKWIEVHSPFFYSHLLPRHWGYQRNLGYTYLRALEPSTCLKGLSRLRPAAMWIFRQGFSTSFTVPAFLVIRCTGASTFLPALPLP